MNDLEFIYKRKSVRNYKDGKIPKEDLLKMLEAATMAPSPKHEQNWHFVVVENKEMIAAITKAVDDSHTRLGDMIPDEEERRKYMRFLPYYTNFRNCESLVLVYCKKYISTEETIMRENGISEEIIADMNSTEPAIQAIGAAVENFLLAAANLGYGACYMTGPNHAKAAIEEIVDFKEKGYFLASMISIGIPEDKEVRQPRRKPLEEVVTFIQ